MHSSVLRSLSVVSWLLPSSDAQIAARLSSPLVETDHQPKALFESSQITPSAIAVNGLPDTFSSPCDFNHLHPRQYAAYHLHPLRPTPSITPRIVIDGLLNDTAWAQVPWTAAFQDIRGPTFWSQPWFTTKAKLRYDQRFLYIGAYLEETQVWANASHHNDVVFHDNDFEVFVDADGSTHNYKEFELNARNATWNLWLNRPYRDGGHENSTRVDPTYGFDMLDSGMQSAVYVKGRVNDPTERLHYWTAEIALPLSELARYSNAKVPPVSTSQWRINFSRVEWPVRVALDPNTGKQVYEKEATDWREENWTWTAQLAVDMHRPEWWGYLHFRPRDDSPPLETDSSKPIPLDPEWGVRYVSFQYYYAQHAFHNATGTYTSQLERLLPYYTDREAILCTNVLDVSASETSFHAHIRSREQLRASDFVARIDQHGYILVDRVGNAADIAALE